MRALLLALLTLVQVPLPGSDIRTIPLPPETAPWARSVVRGLRIVDVRGDGVHMKGSACAVSPLFAFTAAHVIKDTKGQLMAIPNHGYGFDFGKPVATRVHVIWIDEERDLAKLVVDDPVEAFDYWNALGPVPPPGSEVRGILVIPHPTMPTAVPSRGTYYGELDGHLWSSQVTGPGASGSCLLDDQDRVFAILQATANWGHPESGPRASVSGRIPEK